jgi:pantoate--beta-alanine ligase
MSVPVVKTVKHARELITTWKHKGDKIAFVPTMGNLHAGHLALVRTANAAGARTVISIFVNPMQFGENEDFGTYPRTLADDIVSLGDYQVDMLFTPGAAEIYPQGVNMSAFVDLPGLSQMLEGESRPGFFRGVATVVCKLFNIVQPDIAVFGEKDFQQLLVIRRMVADLCMPVRVLSVPTMREADGLAMSSRNAYLDAAQREQAAGLQRCLQHVVDAVRGGMDAEFAVVHASQELEKLGFIPDYVVVRRQRDLAVPAVDDVALIVLAAARIGSTRLIDNIPFDLELV